MSLFHHTEALSPLFNITSNSAPKQIIHIHSLNPIYLPLTPSVPAPRLRNRNLILNLLTIAPIPLPKLPRRQPLQQLRRIRTSPNLRILATTPLSIRYNMKVHHDRRHDAGRGAVEGGNLVGQDSKVRAVEG